MKMEVSAGKGSREVPVDGELVGRIRCVHAAYWHDYRDVLGTGPRWLPEGVDPHIPSRPAHASRPGAPPLGAPRL